MSGHEVRWTFHATAMVADYDEAIGRLGSLFGLRVLEYSESTIPEVGRRGGMTWVGDNSIEIGQPLVAGAGAARFIERSGGGVHSVALQVSDLEASIEHLAAMGVPVAARPDPRFCFTDPRATGGVFFEWADIEVGEDPRFGAPVPPAAPAALPALRHAFIGALVDDPPAWAERFAALLGTEVTASDPGAGPGRPEATVSLRDQVLALYRLEPEGSEAVWGRTYDRARTHLIGLQVDSLDEAAEVLGASGVVPVRRDDRVLVLAPGDVGGIGVALVEQLLDGDPRSA